MKGADIVEPHNGNVARHGDFSGAQHLQKSDDDLVGRGKDRRRPRARARQKGMRRRAPGVEGISAAMPLDADRVATGFAEATRKAREAARTAHHLVAAADEKDMTVPRLCQMSARQISAQLIVGKKLGNLGPRDILVNQHAGTRRVDRLRQRSTSRVVGNEDQPVDMSLPDMIEIALLPDAGYAGHPTHDRLPLV